MSVGINLRRAGVGMASTLAVVLAAPPVLAQTRTEAPPRTITVTVPVVSSIVYGPTRLIGLETPHTVRPGETMLSGRAWAGNLGGVSTIGGLAGALSSASVGLIADFGVMEGLQGQVQAGIGGSSAGMASVMGKYTLFNEAYGGAPLSLGVMARVSGTLPPVANLLRLNLTGTNLGVGFGLPISKSITDKLVVMAVPGLSFIGTTQGIVTSANLGLGADFAITDRFRALIDATLGVPSAGVVAAPAGTAFNAGLRYAFNDNLTTDLYFGIGGLQAITGLNLPVSVPALGLAANYRF